jgi:DNA-binding SARP family transcriptional activator
MTLNNIAMLAFEAGHLADARGALTTALALAQESSRRREEAIIRLSLADLELAEGRLDDAGAQFAAAHTLAQQARIAADDASAAAGAALAAALSGDTASAKLWLDRLPSSDALNPELRGRAALARALTLPTASPDRLSLLAGAARDRDSLASLTAAIADLLLADAQLAADPTLTLAWANLDAAAASLPAALLRSLLGQMPALRRAAPQSATMARHLPASPIERPAARWSISALGHFVCLTDGRPVDLSPLNRTLLVRLIDVGPGGMSVDQLWEDVWGDTNTSIKNLHKALSRLRDQTSLSTAARFGHCSISIPWEQIAYDVQDFERALADTSGSAALQRAIDHYSGEFLPSASPTAQAWVDARRTYLRQRYLTALDHLAALVEPDEPERALALYQRAFQIDRSREQTASRLMALAARQGNHRLASDTFAQLNEALQSLGLTPLREQATGNRQQGQSKG